MSSSSLYNLMSRPRSQSCTPGFPNSTPPDGLFSVDEEAETEATSLPTALITPIPALTPSADSVASTTPSKNPLKRFFSSFGPAESPVNSATSVRGGLSGFSLQMIAIGGSIGTGLFVGTGESLSSSGILPLLASYVLVSVFVFLTCQALGEMAVAMPSSGSFIKYASVMVDESWGFTMGWNYCLQWMFLLPLELVSFTLVLEFWSSVITFDRWILISVVFLVTSILSLFTVKYYGIFETVFSMVKIITLLAFIILGVCIDCGLLSEQPIGFLYLIDPGVVVPNVAIQDLLKVLVAAQFSYAGSELVGLAASESDNPTKQVPKAIKQILWRISVFYLASLVVIGLLVPFDDPNLIGHSSDNLTASPFVLALLNSSFSSNVLSGICNGVIMVSILSVSHNAVYASSKTLISLAQLGQAPSFLTYIDKKGRPLAAIAVTSCAGFIAYLSVLSPYGSKIVFDWLMSLSGLSVFFSYATICLCHIRFRRFIAHRGISVSDLPYKSATGVVGSYCGLIFASLVVTGNTVVTIVTYSDPLLLLQQNLNIMLVLVCFAVHKGVISIKNSKFQGAVRAEDFTFDEGVFSEANEAPDSESKTTEV